MLWRNASSLPLSPVYKAFPAIPWDPLEGRLSLTESDKSLLLSAEENPLEYTLAEKEDSHSYIRLLLKVLSKVKKASSVSLTTASGGSSTKTAPMLSQISLDKKCLSEDEAMQVLYDYPNGVVAHYVITKLYEVIACLQESEITGKNRNSSSDVYSMFYNLVDGGLLDDWRPLLRVLYMGSTADPWAQRGASLCLAHILRAGCPSQISSRQGFAVASTPTYNPVEEPLQALVSWLASRLQSSSVSATLGVVTPTLTVLATCHEARVVLDRAGGIGYLSRHLRMRNESALTSEDFSSCSAGNMSRQSTDVASRSSGSKVTPASASVQQIYELCFCLWTMTYETEDEDLISHFHRDGAVAALCDLVAAAPREKVVRLALSALHNLARYDSSRITSGGKSNSIVGRLHSVSSNPFLTEMIGAGLMKSIETLKDRPWSDLDILEDLTALRSLLQENFREMTRWEVYQSEVESGRLQWGMVHTEKFFKENAQMFEGRDGDFHLLRRLIKLLASDDDDVVAIAIFDVGEFVRHYPNGRSIAKRLGAKDLVMRLIEHENPEVQRHALVCVSKMLVHNWRMVR